jgi:hypothetical protein
LVGIHGDSHDSPFVLVVDGFRRPRAGAPRTRPELPRRRACRRLVGRPSSRTLAHIGITLKRAKGVTKNCKSLGEFVDFGKEIDAEENEIDRPDIKFVLREIEFVDLDKEIDAE